jgi:hypothetical protein
MMGEGGWGCCRGENGGNCREDSLRICQHLVVPKPQHPVPLPFKKPAALDFVRRGGVVLAAIDFDDQPSFVADKVGDIATDRHLPAKAKSLDLPRAKHPPNSSLGLGHCLPQRARSIVRSFGGMFLHVG